MLLFPALSLPIEHENEIMRLESLIAFLRINTDFLKERKILPTLSEKEQGKQQRSNDDTNREKEKGKLYSTGPGKSRLSLPGRNVKECNQAERIRMWANKTQVSLFQLLRTSDWSELSEAGFKLLFMSISRSEDNIQLESEVSVDSV
jgi:hypothetical protein